MSDEGRATRRHRRRGAQEVTHEEEKRACRYCGIPRSDVPQPTRTCRCPALVAHPTCVLRRRALALEGCLSRGRLQGASALGACGQCGSDHTLPASAQQHGPFGPRALPNGHVLLLSVWLADLLALLAVAHALSLAVALPMRLALVEQLLRAADHDGSGRLELAEAVALAGATGDAAGAATLPAVIRHLPPLGEDALSAEALWLLYARMWTPDVLMRDALALRVLEPSAQAEGWAAAWPEAPWHPSAALPSALGAAAVVLALGLGRLYCAAGRPRLASALAVALCDARAVQRTGRPHPKALWARVFATGRPRPRAHGVLLVAALSCAAQWLAAGVSWWAGARVLRAPLLQASLRSLWAPRPLGFSLAPLLLAGGALGRGAAGAAPACDGAPASAREAISSSQPRALDWSWPGAGALCLAACALDVVILPLLAAQLAPAARSTRALEPLLLTSEEES